MSTVTTIVVGASRGIGAELVTQIAAGPNNHVIATVRKSTDTFKNMTNVEVVTLDQTDVSSIDQAASKVTELDTLIMNGAIGSDELLLETSDEKMTDYFTTNILGPLRVIRAFLPILLKSKTKRIVFISSNSGSLEQQIGATQGFRGPYAVSKAAINMIAVQLYNELKEKGVTIVAIHPGWVATDMGNKAGDGAMKPQDSVQGILKVVNALEPGEKVKFVKYDGSTIPW